MSSRPNYPSYSSNNASLDSVTFCEDGFMDAEFSLISENLVQLTTCFQFSLLGLQALFILLSVFAFIWWRTSRKLMPVVRFLWTHKYTLQLSLFLVMFCSITVQLCACSIQYYEASRQHHSIDILPVFSLTSSLVALIFYAVLADLERRSYQTRSHILFSCLIICFLSALPRFYGLVTNPSTGSAVTRLSHLPDQLHLYSMALYICATFGLILTHFGGPHRWQLAIPDRKNACPELWATVPSLWMFTWMTKTIWIAFRGRLSRPEDAFSIPPRDAVQTNFTCFWNAWLKSKSLLPSSATGQNLIVPVTLDEDVPLLTDANEVDRVDDADDSPLLGPDGLPEVNLSANTNNPDEADKDEKQTGTQQKQKQQYPTVDFKLTWLLIKALFSAFGYRLAISWSLIAGRMFSSYLAPILLSYLLIFFSNSAAPAANGYLIALAMLASGFVSLLCGEHGFYQAQVLGLSVRSVLTSAVYRKSLRLSAAARASYTTGEMVNLISVDVKRVMETCTFSFFTWGAVIQFILSLVLLWRQLGLATLAGIGCLLLLMPVNGVIMWLSQKFEVAEMALKDKRMKCLGEVFGAIRIIKLYAWEKAFQAQVKAIRAQEVQRLLRVLISYGVVQVIWTLTPYLILCVTFVAYTWRFLTHSGGENGALNGTYSKLPDLLNPERIFVSVSLFNLMRSPLVMLPWSLSATVMGYVSLRRLATYLLLPEMDDDAVERSLSPDASPFAITFENASFSWSPSGPLVLRNLNLSIPHGWLVAVVGSVGSGKSSMLSACLGDLFKRKGTVRINGKTAILTQTAWIQQQSLRENIYFGDSQIPATVEMNSSDWYRTVVEACALQTDIDRLVDRDDAEIGERGVNLSGGQKQRVSLARAVYQDADIYLLDDPLSAVDSHVGQHLYEQVIDTKTGLLGRKTRLVTTNSFKWLHLADWIVVLNECGQIVQSGTYEDIVNTTHGHFAEYLKKMESHMSQKSKSYIVKRSSQCEKEGASRTDSDTNTNNPIESDEELGQAEETQDQLASTTSPTRFIDDENVLAGRIPWHAYLHYITARGWHFSLVVSVTYGLFLTSQTFANYWLQWFADDHELIMAERALRNESVWQNTTARKELIDKIAERTFYYITSYAWFGVAQLIILTVSLFTFIASSIRASKLMHETMLTRVLRAPTAFFDRTPLGRILNRFSTDIDQLDHNAPDALLDLLSCVCEAGVAVLVIIFSLRPMGIGLAVVLPLLIICIGTQIIYLPCNRQAQRLDSVTRSPLLAHYSETAASNVGVTVVRAFGRSEMFASAADELINRNALFTFLRMASNRWLDMNLSLTNLVLLFLTIVAVVHNRIYMSPGVVGLIVTYAMDLSETFTWLVKQVAQFENSGVSLERLREFHFLDQEACWENGPKSPPPSTWPSPCCEIIFNKATVCYSTTTTTTTANTRQQERPRNDQETAKSDQCALRSISLKLSGQASNRRIGIVGRTGAGKSSLASSLFRLVEPVKMEEDGILICSDDSSSHVEGPIIVDQVDLTQIGLHELRSRFSILPQEPVLFSGTLRFNLDPFDARKDDELWSALESAHLGNWIRADGIGLDYECGEGGSNLSVGQRQLVCLARILVSAGGRVRLLILDEATAAMDPDTDRLVMQTVIGEQFQDATVIIIAHRLSTVLDTDMIVVLDNGQVVETGHPDELLANPKSRFSCMYHAGH